MRKTIALILAVALLMGLCSSISAFADEEKVITISWVSMEDSRKAVWEEYIFKPFLEKHPDVKINFQCIPDMQNTVRVQLAAGVGPDMFYMDSIDIPDFANANRIMSLEKYREQYNLDDVMYGWALKACEYNGQLYSLPHSVEGTALTYNKTLLDKLGLGIPTTREQYVEACETAKANGIIPISFGYSGQPILLTWIWEHYMTTYSSPANVVKLLKGEIGFDDESIRGAFELIKADWDKGYINEKKSGAITMDEARSLFTNQKALFNFEGAWLTLADTEPGTWEFEWGQTVWPSMKDGVAAASGIAVGESIGLNANSKNPDLCMELMIDFYLNEDMSAKAVASGLSTPARPIDESSYPSDMHDDIRKALDAQNNNMLGEVGYAPWAFFPAKLTTYIDDNLDKVMYDRMSMDEFIAQAQLTLEKDFEEGFVFAGG